MNDYNNEQFDEEFADDTKSQSNSKKGLTPGMRSTLISIGALILIMAVCFIYSSIKTKNGDQKQPMADGLYTSAGTLFEGSSVWTESKEDLQLSMELFAKTTGVEPYFLDLTGAGIFTEADINAKAEEFYGEKFSDQGHILTVFYDTGDNFIVASHVGTDAAVVIDDKSLEYINQNIASMYPHVKEDQKCDVWPVVYAQSADSIMTPETDKKLILIVIIVIIIAFGMFKVVRKRSGDDDYNPYF